MNIQVEVHAKAFAVQRGQAIVEAAMVLPLILVLEAARAAATASDPAEAAANGVARGTQVADGYRLQGTTVTVDASDFRPGGRIRADATVRVSLAFVPIFGSGELTLHHQHAEPVDPFRNVR